MRILMLETRRGSEDGFIVRRFDAGQTYELAQMLARRFIRRGWAIEHPQSTVQRSDNERTLSL